MRPAEEDAARALRALAATIDGQAEQRATLAATARQGWLGPHRWTFDEQVTNQARTAAVLAGELRQVARAIEAAAEPARSGRPGGW